MYTGSAEWWLDHKGTKNPESPGMQQYKITAQCTKHTLRNAKHESSMGVWGHATWIIFKKLLYEIEFCCNFDYN